MISEDCPVWPIITKVIQKVILSAGQTFQKRNECVFPFNFVRFQVKVQRNIENKKINK